MNAAHLSTIDPGHASPLFEPIDLEQAFDVGLATASPSTDRYLAALAQIPGGRQVFRGVPFVLGDSAAERRWVRIGDERPLAIGVRASYLVVLHAIVGPPWDDPRDPLSDPEPDFFERVGVPLAEYAIVYADGSRVALPIRRGYEVNWAVSELQPISFAAVSHRGFRAVDWRGPHERQQLQSYGAPGSSPMAGFPGAWAANQVGIGDDRPSDDAWYWLAALPVSRPHLIIESLVVRAAGGVSETVVLGGLTAFRGRTDPLTFSPRQTARITLPSGASAGTTPIEIDLGVLGRPRPAQRPIDEASWLTDATRGWGDARDAEPDHGVIDLEVAANIDATIRIGDRSVPVESIHSIGASEAATSETRVEWLPTRRQQVTVRVLDPDTGHPTPSRVQFRSLHGEYLPPSGHRVEVNPGLLEDYGGDAKLGGTSFAYVPGEFSIELPRGPVLVEVVKGFEYEPLRTRLDIGSATSVLDLRLRRPINLRATGWVTADLHTHSVSPTTALLQAQAEGVNLVGVLACQIGETAVGLAEFAGGAIVDGQGETVVMPGTENRQTVLGHIGLLATGVPVMPLATGGAPCSNLGDPVDVLMADWADRCHELGGLVLSVHFPFPYGEVTADIAMGRIDAVEIFGFGRRPDVPRVRNWYRFLNAGLRVPIVGGTDKMSAGTPIGAVRTYALLDPGESLGFDAFARAVKAGRTFISSGPLLELEADGVGPGSVIDLAASGGTIEVRARATSMNPLDRLELVKDGRVVAERPAGGGMTVELAERLAVDRGCWIAARAVGQTPILTAFPTGVAAHSSPIYVDVGGRTSASRSDADVLMSMIDGGRHWVETLAAVDAGPKRARYSEFFTEARRSLARHLDRCQMRD